jgi:hypothetical protein
MPLVTLFERGLSLTQKLTEVSVSTIVDYTRIVKAKWSSALDKNGSGEGQTSIDSRDVDMIRWQGTDSEADLRDGKMQ